MVNTKHSHWHIVMLVKYRYEGEGSIRDSFWKTLIGKKDGGRRPISRGCMSYVIQVGMACLGSNDMNLSELEHSLRRIRF